MTVSVTSVSAKSDRFPRRNTDVAVRTTTNSATTVIVLIDHTRYVGRRHSLRSCLELRMISRRHRRGHARVDHDRKSRGRFRTIHSPLATGGQHLHVRRDLARELHDLLWRLRVPDTTPQGPRHFDVAEQQPADVLRRTRQVVHDFAIKLTVGPDDELPAADVERAADLLGDEINGGELV